MLEPQHDQALQDADADRVIDVDRSKLGVDEALFWQVCVFCEAYLGPEDADE